MGPAGAWGNPPGRWGPGVGAPGCRHPSQRDSDHRLRGAVAGQSRQALSSPGSAGARVPSSCDRQRCWCCRRCSRRGGCCCCVSGRPGPRCAGAASSWVPSTSQAGCDTFVQPGACPHASAAAKVWYPASHVYLHRGWGWRVLPIPGSQLCPPPRGRAAQACTVCGVGEQPDRVGAACGARVYQWCWGAVVVSVHERFSKASMLGLRPPSHASGLVPRRKRYRS